MVFLVRLKICRILWQMPLRWRLVSSRRLRTEPAQILATIDDQPELFDIEIMDVDLNPRESNKGIRFQVTDANLIRKTGGIIQGLSGAPILQNGKVIGAVTHVLVNDPCKGYGIFIETMIEQ